MIGCVTCPIVAYLPETVVPRIVFCLCRLRRQGPLSPMAAGVATGPRSEVTWQRCVIVYRQFELPQSQLSCPLVCVSLFVLVQFEFCSSFRPNTEVPFKFNTISRLTLFKFKFPFLSHK